MTVPGMATARPGNNSPLLQDAVACVALATTHNHLHAQQGLVKSAVVVDGLFAITIILMGMELRSNPGNNVDLLLVGLASDDCVSAAAQDL